MSGPAQLLPAVLLSRGDAPTIVDVGCSTGYLLEDLRSGFGRARLFGFDFISSGLHTAHKDVPDALLAQADAQCLPLRLSSVDAIVSANLLEHVPDDVEALRQMFNAVKPGGQVGSVVPAGRRLYDYYDRFLHHERRYGRHELSSKGRRRRSSGPLSRLACVSGILDSKEEESLASRSSRRRSSSRAGLRTSPIRKTPIGRLSTRLERSLIARSIRVPFGVRELVVLRRPG